MGWGDLRFERAKHWNWGELKGCFRTSRGDTIAPSDVDFIIERHGHFLVFETKCPDEPLSFGQQWLFRAMAAVPGNRFMVFVITGSRNTPQTIARVKRKGVQDARPTDWNGLRDLCSRWFAWVEGRRGNAPPEVI